MSYVVYTFILAYGGKFSSFGSVRDFEKHKENKEDIMEILLMVIVFAGVLAIAVANRVMKMAKSAKCKMRCAITQMCLGILLTVACLPYVSEIGIGWMIVFAGILIGAPATLVYKTAKEFKDGS